jgi:ABC-type nickel/cobalt efflux system permease component RcnA
VSEDLILLTGTAATLGFVHTLIGPDHYLPFITLARARGWSMARTAGVTLASGIGHVAGSVVLGLLGVLLGWAIGGLERFESLRGEIAGWLLLGFGLAYLAWGLRHAWRRRPHSHWHVHADGTLHQHDHTHLEEHAHLHDGGEPAEKRRFLQGATAWTLFLVFVVGPCEPLVPILMYPAAAGSLWGVALVTAVFALTTLATMTAMVLIGRASLARLPSGRWERWSHVAAGTIVVLCGLAIV